MFARRMGDEDDIDAIARRAPRAALHDAFKRYAALRHARRDLGEGAGDVAHRHADVIAAFVTLHRHTLELRELRGRQTERRRTHPLGDVGDVGDDRRGRRVAAGAWPNKRQLMHRVGVDGDGVQDAHHLGDGGILADHRRMNALLDPLSGALRDAEQLDAVAKLRRGVDVGERHALNALDIDRAGGDARAKRQRGEDREQIIVSLPRGERIDSYIPYRRRQAPPSFELNDWREAVVAIVAHEGQHHRQLPRARFGERECDWAAYRAVMRYRGEIK